MRLIVRFKVRFSPECFFRQARQSARASDALRRFSARFLPQEVRFSPPQEQRVTPLVFAWVLLILRFNWATCVILPKRIPLYAPPPLSPPHRLSVRLPEGLVLLVVSNGGYSSSKAVAPLQTLLTILIPLPAWLFSLLLAAHVPSAGIQTSRDIVWYSRIAV